MPGDFASSFVAPHLTKGSADQDLSPKVDYFFFPRFGGTGIKQEAGQGSTSAQTPYDYSVSVGPGSEDRSEVALCYTKVAILYSLFDFLQIQAKHPKLVC